MLQDSHKLVVRVFGPDVANVTMPLVLLSFTGSSWIFASFHLAVTCGSAAIPNCAMNMGSTRKKRAPL